MWQRKFQQYRERGFTVVGIALDAEGVAPAKRYYDRFGCTFPTLVDPNYATRFQVVPKTFFVDERGVVQALDGWEATVAAGPPPAQVRDALRKQWSAPEARTDPAEVRQLAAAFRDDPEDLPLAVDLGSRYLDRGMAQEAARVLQRVTSAYDARQVALGDDARQAEWLAQAHFQLARALAGDRAQQVRHATLSFYLDPSIGYGKQIARIIAPEKFDGRADGSFDNRFREATLSRLREERREWLAASPDR